MHDTYLSLDLFGEISFGLPLISFIKKALKGFKNILSLFLHFKVVNINTIIKGLEMTSRS